MAVSSPTSTDSSASSRSGISLEARSYTYYDNFSDPFVKAIDVNSAWDTTQVVSANDSLNLTTAVDNRTSKGVPVVIGDPKIESGNVSPEYNIVDIVPKSQSDSGFYKDRTTGKKVLTKYKYINKELWIPGTDGQPIYYAGYYVPTGAPTPTPSAPRDTQSTITESTKGYLWNLPPHKWSLPFNASSSGMITPGGTRKGSVDKYRRGRIWSAYKANTYITDAQGNKNWSKDNLEGNGFGFQFLWNPDNLTTSVAVTMDATPNQNDQWLGAVGLFPATEQFSISVRLDRTNDFARAGARFGRPQKLAKGDPQSNDFISESQIIDLLPEYKVKDSFTMPDSVKISNLKDLFQRGTLGDLEYLFMAINGKGPSPSSNWVNPRGIETANIGWLQPNLVHIDIGPLSYLGWVTNLSITHTMFTQDMIPIRTDLQMSFNTLATAGIGSAFADSSNPNGPGPSAPNTGDGKPDKIPNYSAWDAMGPQ
jgi:hypothetical protein